MSAETKPTASESEGDRRGFWFQLGKDAGIKEERERILNALGVPDMIAEYLSRHEQGYHGDEP